MRYGVSLIMRGREATPEAFARLAERAEAFGFDALWASSHVIIPPQVKSGYVMIPGRKHPPSWKECYWEPFTVLGHLAALTRRIRLGTSVTVLPMHNPFEVAKQAAQVDQLSGGRFVLGVGVGWFSEEFEVLQRDYHTRGARTDEALELIRRLWSEEPVSYHGRFYRVEDACFGPKPAQRPGPPVWIAGHSDAALRRTARFADCWHPVRLESDVLRERRQRLNGLLEAAGRDPQSVGTALKTPLVFRDSAPAPAQVITEGRPRDIAAAISAYARLGVAELVFDFAPETLATALDAMERFSNEVLPLLE